jgi:Ca-activated chloride channel family protein
VVSFAEPDLLWLLWVPALAALLVVARHRRRLRQQRRLASPGVWDRLMGGAPATGLLRMIGWCVAAALVALALARPQWGELPAEESIRTRDLVVALDVSDSMLSPDLRPTRLGRSLEVVRSALPGLEGNRVGIVVFAGEAYPLVPLTTDLGAVTTFLDAVHPGMVALPGSNLQVAVEASLRMLPAEGEGRVLVFVTDGENLQGDVEAAAKRLRDAGVGVLAVVAGTSSGGPIPMLETDGSVRYKRDAGGQPVVTRAHPEVLAEIAADVDGEVLELAGGAAVRELIDRVERLRTREIEATRSVVKVERFPIFLVAAAAILGMAFALSPWRRTAAVVGLVILGLLPTATVAQTSAAAQTAAAAQASALAQTPAAGDQPPAGDEAAAKAKAPSVVWWQRWIPGGSRRLARSGAAEWRDGELATAADDFAGAAILDPDNPERLYDLGTVLIAGAQLEQAAPLLVRSHEQGIDTAAYNLGTGSLTSGQADQAVRWLRAALLQDPDDPDVKRNYELALRQQQQQQQEQQGEQQEQQDEQQEQQQDDQQEQQPTPTPKPQPAGAQPTPTPDPNSGLYAALDRAEAEAREQMRSPTPRATSVEKDW